MEWAGALGSSWEPGPGESAARTESCGGEGGGRAAAGPHSALASRAGRPGPVDAAMRDSRATAKREHTVARARAGSDAAASYRSEGGEKAAVGHCDSRAGAAGLPRPSPVTWHLVESRLIESTSFAFRFCAISGSASISMAGSCGLPGRDAGGPASLALQPPTAGTEPPPTLPGLPPTIARPCAPAARAHGPHVPFSLALARPTRPRPSPSALSSTPSVAPIPVLLPANPECNRSRFPHC